MSGRRGRSWTALAAGTAAVVASVLLLPATSAGATDGDGQVLARGAAPVEGAPGETASPVTGLASSPSGDGYWVLTADGDVRAYGDATYLGAATDEDLARPAVDLAAHPSGNGYWLATEDGDVQAFGYARDLGSLAGRQLAAPVVGIDATSSGNGYWLVARDGGVFAFGDAAFLGSLAGAEHGGAVGIAATPDGRGYWVAGADGSVTPFGTAVFLGAIDRGALTAPVVSIASSSILAGYWLVTADGHVHPFGTARDFGSPSVQAPVSDLAVRPGGDGYWVATGSRPRVRAESTGQAVTYRPASAPEPAPAAAPAPQPAPQPAPAPARSGEPSDADFDRLARCESGGRWNLNTGNGYYGGLQFSASTWRALGGSGLPSEHTRAEQIEMGRRQWHQSGWRAWPSCARQTGLA